MITKEQVIDAQNEWGSGVVKIGSLKDSRQECEDFTSNFLDKLYSFDNGPVLFKPTKCKFGNLEDPKQKRHPILSQEMIEHVTKMVALQLTLGLKLDLKIQTSFWKKIEQLRWAITFSQTLMETRAKMEYTFGYKLVNGALNIDVHHSSFPYNP